VRSGHLLVASAVAVVVGAVAVLGSLPREDLTLVWVAIGAVGVALVSLTAGVLVHRAGAPGAADASSGDASPGLASPGDQGAGHASPGDEGADGEGPGGRSSAG
jgi:hypothetical protein